MLKLFAKLRRIFPRLVGTYQALFLLFGMFALLLLGYFVVAQRLTASQEERSRERAAIEKATTPAWERKTDTEQELRLGLHANLRLQLEDDYTFATDVEDRYYAIDKYRKPLVFFRSQMREYDPDYVVALGDVIAGEDQDQFNGADALTYARRQFEKVDAPTLWVLGNREMQALTRTQFQEVTDAPHAPYSIDKGDYRIIVLDSNNTRDGEPYDATSSSYDRGNLSEAQFEWLDGELKTARHVIVFMHHGSFERAVPRAGKTKRTEKSIHDAERLRDVFAQYNVDTVVTSHLGSHAYEEADGVEYFAIEDLRDYGHHPGAFYELTLRSGDASMQLYYTDRENEKLISQDFQEGVYVAIPEDDDEA